MGSTLLPLVTEGLPRVSPAVGSSPTSIFFMPVVRPKLVVKAARKLASSWRFATGSLENAQRSARGAGQGLLRSHPPPGDTTPLPGGTKYPLRAHLQLCSHPIQTQLQSTRGGGFGPEHALPSPYPWNSSWVTASPDPWPAQAVSTPAETEPSAQGSPVHTSTSMEAIKPEILLKLPFTFPMDVPLRNTIFKQVD